MTCLDDCKWTIAFCLQHVGKKFRCFIWAKRSTAQCVVMSNSACSNTPLLFHMLRALPSERAKPSGIAWTIEIFLVVRWVLLGMSPALSSNFWVGDCTSCRRSLISNRPALQHPCSRQMPRETACAQQQVARHFDGAQANWSIFHLLQPIAHISFILHGTAKWTRETEPSRPINRDFCKFCWVVPHIGPEA